MDRQELYDIVREAEIEAFDTWQNPPKIVTDSNRLNNYHTAFLVLHFLSRALRPKDNEKRNQLQSKKP